MKIDYTVTQVIKDVIRKEIEKGAKHKAIVATVQAMTGWGATKARETINTVTSEIETDDENALPIIKEGVKVLDAVNKTTDVTPKVKHINDLNIEAKIVNPGATYSTSNIKITPEGVVLVASNDEDVKLVDKIEDAGTHVFNHDTKQFIWQLKNGGTFVLSEGTWKAVLREYKGNATIQQISAKHSILPAVLKEVFAKEGITHDSHPFTSQDLKTKTPEVLSEEERKFAFAQSMEKEAWKSTQRDADKWREFEFGTLNPFETFLTNWTPPEYKKVSCRNIYQKQTNLTFVAGCFDWHFGALAEQRYLYKGLNWNIEQAHKSVNKYIEGIEKKVRTMTFDKGVIMFGGDLYNSLTGFTENGTKLLNEVGRDTQFEAVMDAMINMCNAFLELFPEVEVQFVRGNHGGTTDIPLAWAVKNYYRNEQRLKFNITSCRTKSFRVYDTLILLDHGASDQSKSLVPGPGKARESYIQGLFLAHPDALVGIKQKIFVMGDQHHFEQHEYADFEFVMMGALPCGDQYSDSKNLHNRARQNCLIIGPDGLEATLHVYLD